MCAYQQSKHIYFGFLYQTEIKYGSYKACGSNYTTQLQDIVRGILDDAAMLYSTDGAGLPFLKCGKIGVCRLACSLLHSCGVMCNNDLGSNCWASVPTMGNIVPIVMQQ
jgi:hypothetical protein